MNYFVIGIIMILALFAIRFSHKHGIPALLLFIVLGMSFGALGLEFDNYEIADNFATISLMVIMFYGGFGTNWRMAKPVAKQAIILSSLGVAATAMITSRSVCASCMLAMISCCSSMASCTSCDSSIGRKGSMATVTRSSSTPMAVAIRRTTSAE